MLLNQAQNKDTIMSKFYSLSVALWKGRMEISSTTPKLLLYCILLNMFIFIDFRVVLASWQASCKGYLRIFITDYQSFILNPVYAINSR